MGFVYIPKFTPQINPADKFGGVNCGAYATSYAVDRATMGGIQVSGSVVRRATNEPIPDPHSPGLNIPQLVNAVFAWHVQLNNRTGAPWASVLAALHEHRGVVLSGDYDQIPAKYSGQTTFKGDHSVYLNHLSNDGMECWWMDPLNKAGGFYMPAAIAKAYATKFAKTIGTYPGLAFITTRQTPSLATAP
jgi:hypothetical protein